MPATITPEMTREERRAALIQAAHDGIAAAKATGNAEALEQLAGLYSREAARARLLATRMDAEAAFRAADEAFTTHEHAHHASDLGRAQMLDERGVNVLSPRFLDHVRDAEEVRAGAQLFATLADACRSSR